MRVLVVEDIISTESLDMFMVLFSGSGSDYEAGRLSKSVTCISIYYRHRQDLSDHKVNPLNSCRPNR